jgi:hypothetical protein
VNYQKVVLIKTFADIANGLERLGYKQTSEEFKEYYKELRSVFVGRYYLYLVTEVIKEKKDIDFPNKKSVTKSKVGCIKDNLLTINKVDIYFDVDHTSWIII